MVLDPNTPEFSSELVRNGNGSGASAATNRQDESGISPQKIFTIVRRRIGVMSSVTLASTLMFSTLILSRPARHTGKFRLLVEPVTEGSRIAESLTSDTLQTLRPKGWQPNQADGLDYVSQLEVLKSETLLDPTVQRIQTRYPEIDYGTLMGRLKIVRPKDSKVLDFSYTSSDREEIKFVLNELLQVYLRYSIGDRKTNLNRGIEFVNAQIDNQRHEVAKLERQLEQLRRQNSVIDPQEVTKVMAGQLSDIHKTQAENQVKLASAGALFANLQQQIAQTPSQAVDLATLSEAPNYQNLLTRLRDIDSRIAIESARFREGTPMLESLRDQRQNLLPLIQAEAQRVLKTEIGLESAAQVEYQGTVARELIQQYVVAANQVQVLQAEKQGIAQAVEQFQQQTQQLAGVAREYGQISRNLEIATASLSRLMTARENLQLESARQSSPWELISKLDDRSISQKMSRSLLLMLGALAGLAAGIAAALLAEQFDRVFHTVEELKDTNLPCLGVIPFNPILNADSSLVDVSRIALTDLPTTSDPPPRTDQHQATFLEAFYSLDANIRLLSSDASIRALTVSSSSAGDGKSTIAAHLAWAAVTMGRRVLLIDTDLRSPQVHRWFGIPNIQGLSTVITSDIDVMELIQESPQDSNLFLLPAGPTPPAPGRLLGSNKMQRTMAQLIHQFDLIICDAPALLGLADAKLTAAHTDGILLTVGLGKTDRRDFAQMLDELRGATPVPILGIVANGLKRYTINYYHNYQRHYNQPTARSLISMARRSYRR